MVKLKLSQTALRINELLLTGLRPTEIQKELHIGDITYYRKIKELNQYYDSPEVRMSFDQRIMNRFDKYEREVDKGLAKVKDKEKAPLISAGSKINKDLADYLFRIGKLKEVDKKLILDHNIQLTPEDIEKDILRIGELAKKSKENKPIDAQ